MDKVMNSAELPSSHFHVLQSSPCPSDPNQTEVMQSTTPACGCSLRKGCARGWEGSAGAETLDCCPSARRCRSCARTVLRACLLPHAPLRRAFPTCGTVGRALPTAGAPCRACTCAYIACLPHIPANIATLAVHGCVHWAYRGAPPDTCKIQMVVPNQRPESQSTPRYSIEYGGTSRIKNSASLGSYSRTMPRALWWSLGRCHSSRARYSCNPDSRKLNALGRPVEETRSCCAR